MAQADQRSRVGHAYLLRNYLIAAASLSVLVTIKAFLQQVLPDAQFRVLDVIVIGLITYLFGLGPGLLGLLVSATGYALLYMSPSPGTLILDASTARWVEFIVYLFGAVIATLAMSSLRESRTRVAERTNQLEREIEERKHAEEEMRRSRTLLAEAEKLSHTGAWEWDLTTNQWTFSDEWLRVHGCEKRTLTPEELLNIGYPDDRVHIAQALEGARSGTSAYDIEHRIIRQDNAEVRIVRAHGRYVKDESGEVVKVYGFVQDITEQKLAEEEIRKLNAELEQRVVERTAELQSSNRELEAAYKEMQTLSYSIMHDLRTPLRAIGGFSDAVLRHHAESLDPKGLNYLQRIGAAARRMGRIIDDIHDLLRATRAQLQIQDVHISVIAREILDKLAQSEPHRKAEITIQPGLVAAGDADMLRAALGHLLGNAWKFTSVRDVTHIQVAAIERNGERVYVIRDNGVGFDPAYADKLFVPFQRLHRESEFPGSGIGLALVERIVRRHGGRIWAESEVGKGAVFYFTLGDTDT